MKILKIITSGSILMACLFQTVLVHATNASNVPSNSLIQNVQLADYDDWRRRHRHHGYYPFREHGYYPFRHRGYYPFRHGGYYPYAHGYYPFRHGGYYPYAHGYYPFRHGGYYPYAHRGGYYSYASSGYIPYANRHGYYPYNSGGDVRYVGGGGSLPYPGGSYSEGGYQAGYDSGGGYSGPATPIYTAHGDNGAGCCRGLYGYWCGGHFNPYQSGGDYTSYPDCPWMDG